MKFFYNPISTYSQKALMALLEKGVSFEPQVVNVMSPEGRAAYEALYPLGKIPLLVDDDGTLLPESSAIVEFLELRFAGQGTRLLPSDPRAAVEARRWDRFADCMLNEPMSKIFFDGRKPAEQRDPAGVKDAFATVQKGMAYLDAHLAKNTWLAGEFSLADCSAAPPLFYLKNVAPYESFKNVTAYASRLLERPSYLKVMSEAMPILKALMGG